MIFEYRCSRCGQIISQRVEGKRGFYFEIECAVEKKTTEDSPGQTSSPYPDWIYHKGCPGIFYTQANSFVRVEPSLGTGIATLIGGREE